MVVRVRGMGVSPMFSGRAGAIVAGVFRWWGGGVGLAGDRMAEWLGAWSGGVLMGRKQVETGVGVIPEGASVLVMPGGPPGSGNIRVAEVVDVRSLRARHMYFLRYPDGSRGSAFDYEVRALDPEELATKTLKGMEAGPEPAAPAMTPEDLVKMFSQHEVSTYEAMMAHVGDFSRSRDVLDHQVYLGYSHTAAFVHMATGVQLTVYATRPMERDEFVGAMSMALEADSRNVLVRFEPGRLVIEE